MFDIFGGYKVLPYSTVYQTCQAGVVLSTGSIRHFVRRQLTAATESHPRIHIKSMKLPAYAYQLSSSFSQQTAKSRFDIFVETYNCLKVI